MIEEKFSSYIRFLRLTILLANFKTWIYRQVWRLDYIHLEEEKSIEKTKWKCFENASPLKMVINEETMKISLLVREERKLLLLLLLNEDRRARQENTGRQTWVQFCHALGDWLGEQLVMALTTLLLAVVVVAAPMLDAWWWSFVSVLLLLLLLLLVTDWDDRMGEISANDWMRLTRGSGLLRALDDCWSTIVNNPPSTWSVVVVVVVLSTFPANVVVLEHTIRFLDSGRETWLRDTAKSWPTGCFCCSVIALPAASCCCCCCCLLCSRNKASARAKLSLRDSGRGGWGLSVLMNGVCSCTANPKGRVLAKPERGDVGGLWKASQALHARGRRGRFNPFLPPSVYTAWFPISDPITAILH